MTELPSSFALHTLPILLGPLLLALAGLTPAGLANRAGRRFAQLAAGLALGALASALVAAALLLVRGPVSFTLFAAGPLRLSFHYDALSALMLTLVAFLGAVVTRYTVPYLDGDPRHGVFSQRLCATLAAVLTLVISGNLLLFTLAWIATSLSLHRLLTFCAERPAALLAARKKFLISRLGDACLVGALGLTWHCFGTWDFAPMFAAAGAGGHASCVNWSGVLLAAGALLKSAQFPFHSWLPDTMETPTPVSALMHAGIINAGGFLVVRLSPLISAAPAALHLLALAGAFTALFASVVMLPQTSVKRSLAWSTIAQMGFMMLQCGLGAFALAVLHLVAHSLYKAHAFLSSGSVVALSRSAWTLTERPAAHPLILAASLGAAAALVAGIGTLFGVTPASGPAVLLLAAIFAMGVASLLWNLWASSHRAALILPGALLAAAVSASYFALHALSGKALASALPHYAPERSPAELGVMALVALLFGAVLLAGTQLPGWTTTRLGRAFYVHASQGFYLGTLANRLTATLFGKLA